MNEKFNSNAKVEQLTKMFLSRGEEKALSLKVLSPRYLHAIEVLFRYRNEVADHNGIQFKKTRVFFNIKLKLL